LHELVGVTLRTRREHPRIDVRVLLRARRRYFESVAVRRSVLQCFSRTRLSMPLPLAINYRVLILQRTCMAFLQPPTPPHAITTSSFGFRRLT